MTAADRLFSVSGFNQTGLGLDLEAEL